MGNYMYVCKQNLITMSVTGPELSFHKFQNTTSKNFRELIGQLHKWRKKYM